ncbi:hypothetical protein ACJX0J_033060 [Zea mays]
MHDNYELATNIGIPLVNMISLIEMLLENWKKLSIRFYLLYLLVFFLNLRSEVITLQNDRKVYAVKTCCFVELNIWIFSLCAKTKEVMADFLHKNVSNLAETVLVCFGALLNAYPYGSTTSIVLVTANIAEMSTGMFIIERWDHGQD